MHNIYYDPEKCGLEIVGVLDEDDLSYEFNTLIVLRATESKKLYWAQSSGCSCPTPFEEYSYVSDIEHNLSELNRESLETFVNEVRNFPVSMDERQKLITSVRRRLRNR